MRKTIIVAFFFSFTLNAQQIKNWQNFTNMRLISDFAIQNNSMWAGTEGGIFNYSDLDVSIQTLTKSEGLSSHSITSLAIDNSGKIWVGSSEGYINVYDPSNNEMSTILQVFKTNRTNKRINDIQISGDTAFVSTAFGLSLVNTNDLSFFDSILKFGDFVTETPVINVYLDDKIYVVTQAGIAINDKGQDNLIAPESWRNILIGEMANVQKINKIIRFRNQLYAATDKGLLKENGENWDIFLHENFEVFDIYKKDNVLYSVLYNTIHRFEQSNQLIFRSPNNVLSGINFLNGDYFMASNHGIIKWDGTDTLAIFPNSPETNAIIDIAVDSENNLWVATGKNGQGIGALKFNGSIWETLNRENVSTFKTNDFHIVNNYSNSLYLSTWGKGFIRLRDNNYDIFDTENTSMIGIPEANEFLVINDIAEDPDGNAWILNYWAADRKPLSVLTNDGEFYSYEFSSPLTPRIVNVKNLVIDQFNTKWITGDLSGDEPTEGLYYFNENGTFNNTSDDVWGRLTESNGLRNRDVKALAIDQFGELIIGTSMGVDVISNPSNPNSIRGDQYFALRQQTINSIVVDPINQKWFGTEKGVFLTNSDGSVLLANYTKTNSPLPSDVIKSLAVDENNGIIYVGTDFGLTAIYTLFIKPNQNFSDLFVYPNPITLGSTSDVNIIIEGLIEDSEIKILDVSGNLINEFRSIGGKTTTWNCKDFNGNLISSGIYIVVAYDEEVNEIGHAKFAVLRK